MMNNETNELNISAEAANPLEPIVRLAKFPIGAKCWVFIDPFFVNDVDRGVIFEAEVERIKVTIEADDFSDEPKLNFEYGISLIGSFDNLERTEDKMFSTEREARESGFERINERAIEAEEKASTLRKLADSAKAA